MIINKWTPAIDKVYLFKKLGTNSLKPTNQSSLKVPWFKLCLYMQMYTSVDKRLSDLHGLSDYNCICISLWYTDKPPKKKKILGFLWN